MLPSTTVLGKYRLLQPLGQGSNAAVFLAEALDVPGQQVVVKRIHPHIVNHPKFAEMFQAEVRSMALLRHPYTVRLHAAADDPQLGPVLIMDYVPGATLEHLLRRWRRLDPERVGRLLGCLCHALDHAHGVGIVHRDLKPANLMVQRAGTVDEILRVMDFGFAGFATKPFIQPAALTGRGSIQALGTPSYVSPEMIRGDTVDPRSDLYSVGVILYEMLTGRLPFPYPGVQEVLAAHVRKMPPSFAQIGVRDVPAEIEAVVQLCLSKYPNERPQTAQELAQQYSRALGPQRDIWAETAPATPPPPPPPMPVPGDSREIPHPSPYLVQHTLEVHMPERLIAAKLRGFVEDLLGEVVTSEPGRILLRLGLPDGYHQPATTSGIFRWLHRGKPRVERNNEPIEVEFLLHKPQPPHSWLRMTLYYRPLPEYPPHSLEIWRQRCDKLNNLIRQYLGA